jgi:hypothetical protein
MGMIDSLSLSWVPFAETVKSEEEDEDSGSS